MKEIFRTQSPAELDLIKSLLKSGGIGFSVSEDANPPFVILVQDADHANAVNFLQQVSILSG